MTHTESDDFYRRVADYFVFRRGRGLALSSGDQACAATWRERGAHFIDAAAAIDAACAARREPPRSLSDCSRWLDLPPVEEARVADLLFDLHDTVGEGSGASSETSTPAGGAGVSVQASDRVLERLDRWSASAEDEVVRRASAKLAEELRERLDSKLPVELEIFAVLDDALLVLIAEELPEDRGRALLRESGALPPSRRSAWLAAELNSRFDVELPQDSLLSIAAG